MCGPTGGRACSKAVCGLVKVAGALVLERRADADARRAPIFGALTGYAMGFCGASVHRIIDVTQDAIAACMEEALRRSGPRSVRCRLCRQPRQWRCSTGRHRAAGRRQRTWARTVVAATEAGIRRDFRCFRGTLGDRGKCGAEQACRRLTPRTYAW